MHKKIRGFTLIEVIIAVLIVGVMLILLGAVTRSNALIRISKNQGVALSIARNKLESLRIGGYSAIPMSGSFADNLVNSLPLTATTTLTVSEYNNKTKEVTVGVVWRDPGSTASSTVSLSTLITETGGLP